ncbi:DUF488 family protein [Emcibacter sp.]|uniref:DUF488 family protein, N3 subclade n=1 Tax=Emcibacter sp. TaxID=1979954 RepID=UPI002AA8254F|nr:DUF488 family protein [Emcibacter sp.]
MEIVTRFWRQETDDLFAGYRVLVDPVWPDPETWESMLLDDWWKEVAPSDNLWKECQNNRLSTNQLKEIYRNELNARRSDIVRYLKDVPAEPLVLFSGESNKHFNTMGALYEYLLRLIWEEEYGKIFSSPPCYLADHTE